MPTEHRMTRRILDVASRRLAGFYNFEGLRRFKAKFVPSWWESEYALAQRGVAMPPRVGHAVVRALVPGGLTQLLTRQALRVISSNGPYVTENFSRQSVTKSIPASSNPAEQ